MMLPATSLQVPPMTMNTALLGNQSKPESSFSDMLASALGHVNSAYAKEKDGTVKMVTGQTEETHSGAIKTERSGVLLHLTVQAAAKMTSCITTILQIPL